MPYITRMKKIEWEELERKIEDNITGIVYFKYGESLVEKMTIDEFIIFNQGIKRISNRVIHKASKKEYSPYNIKKSIETEYSIEKKPGEFHIEWISIQELYNRLTKNDVNIVEIWLLEI